MSNVTLADGWVFVGRTHGLDAATHGNAIRQARLAASRVQAALATAGCTMAQVTRGRWLVPLGAPPVPPALAMGLPTALVAQGLFDPGVLVELELRARQG